mgnify:CR=1 FL=1
MSALQVTGGVLPLNGDLTLETVDTWYRQLCAVWGGSASPTVVDLAGAGRIDSAGLALLIEWKARASKRGEALTLKNPPRHLLQLAAMSEATELLGLGSGEPTE